MGNKNWFSRYKGTKFKTSWFDHALDTAFVHERNETSWTLVSLNQIIIINTLAKKKKKNGFRGLLSLTEKLLYSEIFDSINIVFLLEVLDTSDNI